MEEKAKHTIKTIIADIVVVFLGLSYVLFRMLTLVSRNLKPLDMLIDGLLGIAVGIAIKQTLGEKGLLKGYDTEEYKIEKENHSTACNDSIDYIDYYDIYEDETIAERKKKYRKMTLQQVRLKYEDFFKENGESKDVIITKKWKVAKRLKNRTYVKEENEFVLDYWQRLKLKKCNKVKIKILNLFSEYNNYNYNFSDKETTDKQQRAIMFSKNLLSAVAFTLAGLYFVPKVVEFDIGAIMFASVQVFGFVATGITQMFENINFVRVEKANTLKEKTKRLSGFINNCKKGKYNERLVKEKQD